MLNKFEYLASSRSFTHTVCFSAISTNATLHIVNKISTRVFSRVSTAYTHIHRHKKAKKAANKCKKTSSSLKT